MTALLAFWPTGDQLLSWAEVLVFTAAAVVCLLGAWAVGDLLVDAAQAWWQDHHRPRVDDAQRRRQLDALMRSLADDRTWWERRDARQRRGPR